MRHPRRQPNREKTSLRLRKIFAIKNEEQKSWSSKFLIPSASASPEIDGDRILSIAEKPSEPKSNYAVTGIYMFDGTVFDKIERLERSDRGELEITDVNNQFIKEGTMTWGELDGWWTDAGTIESLLRASIKVAETGANRI